MHSQHRGMVDMGSHTFSYLLGCVSLVVPGILSHEGKAWRMVWVSRLITVLSQRSRHVRAS